METSWKKSVRIMHEQIDLQNGSPIKVKFGDYDYFHYPWHFHSEYEIVYVVKSFGTRYVGNSVESFTDGDLTFLGSFLPHMYKSDDIYTKGETTDRVHAIIIQFSKELALSPFFNYPEFKRIQILLKKSEYGLQFPREHSKEIIRQVGTLLKKKGTERLFDFLKILDLMSKNKHVRLLGNDSFENVTPAYRDKRISKILTYINRNYQQELKLEEIASIAGMNITAFCRYFKEKTGKSLMEYTNELRIGYACRVLITDLKSISEVCFDAGFNNISNFNRCFKRIMNLTPTQYIRQYEEIAVIKEVIEE